MILLEESLQRPLDLENAIEGAADSMSNSFIALKQSENHRSEFADFMKTAMLRERHDPNA